MTETSVTEDTGLEHLLEFIRDERGFDFTGYKRPSLVRRIRKRMDAVRIADFEEYCELLARDRDEFAHLFDTILINVTSFFRDAPFWAYLAEEIVPRIIGSRDEKEPIRVWSTGCATGEEAYTAAMILAEALGEDAFRARAKVYATDVDEGALSEGRHAVFPAKALSEVPDELRERYFDPLDSRFVFRKEIRRNVVFGRHDLVQDAPISRIDLLVSRNTLMYFEAETQRRILAHFHFALRDDGYLFLGKSEVLVTRTSLFAPVDLKRRVFTKVPRQSMQERLAAPGTMSEPRAHPARAGGDELRLASFELAPVAQIVLDVDGALVQANHQARVAFGLTESDFGRSIQDHELSYRPVELRSHLDEAYGVGHAVAIHDVEHTAPGGEAGLYDVHIAPLHTEGGATEGATIYYTDVTRFRRLEKELADARREADTAHEELQSAVEELETTNEELQSTNEELETTNEELQSTNEELETMNEELQSINEELETMNDELRLRTDEVNQVNLFLESIMTSLGAAVVVVDAELRVEIWNDEAADLWGLRPDEARGRHLMNLDFGLPLELIHRPLRAALAGETADPAVVDAINRRGRRIRCHVRAMPLNGTSGSHGVILVMEAEPVDD